MKPDLRRLIDAPKDEKPRLFLDYSRKVIKAKNRGEIEIWDAGYQIAETMFIQELDEPLFEEITAVAGRLELPRGVLMVDPDEQWKHLVKLVYEYAERLKQS